MSLKFIFFFFCVYLNAQSALSVSQISQGNPSQSKLNQFSLYKNVKQKEIISEAIDPKEFIVGPGDIFMVDIVTSNLVAQFELIISVTGDLIIPMVDKININGQSLDKAISTIKKSFKEQYSDAQLSIVLKDAGHYNIYIKHPYGMNDEYKVNSFMRISDVFEIISKSLINNKYDISNISNRNIKVKNKSGEEYFDLQSFYTDGNYSNNPYINRGDRIEFFLTNSSIEIWGGIAKPGKYNLLENESLANLINLAGGFLETAYKDTIIITRVNNNREHIEIDFEKQNDFIIIDKDIINIKDKNRNLYKEVAFISGEILFPGFYNIDNSITSIEELINLAGGFTESANQNLVMIEGRNISQLNIANIENKPQEYLTESDISWVDVGMNHYINNRSIINSDEFSNYKLANGDKINILSEINFIEIIGAVNKPGKYPYYKNYTASEYIRLAGGKKKNSLKNNYIIEQGSIVKRIIESNQTINGGDIIFVPYDLEVNKWTRFKDWMTVIGQIAAFIVLVQNIGMGS